VWERATIRSFAGADIEGERQHAMLVGPPGVELDLAYFMGDNGEGQVSCLSRGGSPEAWQRLVHGGRLGVYLEGGDLVIKQLRLMRWDASAGWGNPRMTTVEGLDGILGGSAERLFHDLGATALGTKREVLGVNGNDLAVRWPEAAGPAVAFAAYALTRALPIALHEVKP
jgi:hypothetical protein